MERFTISLDDDLAAEFDTFIAEQGYQNRSEAVRDLLRSRLQAKQLEKEEPHYCVANLSYVYNHHERTLPERLTNLQHDHHILTVATLHAHLSHNCCIESVILKGHTVDVRTFANAVMAEKGVLHGQVNLIAQAGDEHHH
jgi:CopG family nickel-responsive transcriptional regulator